MTSTIQRILAATCICTMAACGGRAAAQTAPCPARLQSTALTESKAQPAVSSSQTAELLPTERPQPSPTVVAPEVPCAPEPMFDVADSNTKFRPQSLMTTLRDPTHESWVLAAYPDPKTGRPLIGAGFSLDVQATDHPQLDPLNPHPFVEPSSVQLWQAAGLSPDRLQQILNQFDHDASAWTTKQYRRKVIRHKLTPQLTEEEATGLLRISAIQAVYNAKAYCRCF